MPWAYNSLNHTSCVMAACEGRIICSRDVIYNGALNQWKHQYCIVFRQVPSASYKPLIGMMVILKCSIHVFWNRGKLLCSNFIKTIICNIFFVANSTITADIVFSLRSNTVMLSRPHNFAYFVRKEMRTFTDIHSYDTAAFCFWHQTIQTAHDTTCRDTC